MASQVDPFAIPDPVATPDPQTEYAAWCATIFAGVSLPTLSQVSDDNLRRLLLSAAGNLTVLDRHPPCVIVKHQGRCVELKRADGSAFPSYWEMYDLLSDLCQQYRVDGFRLRAMLYTNAQDDANYAAWQLDDDVKQPLDTDGLRRLMDEFDQNGGIDGKPSQSARTRRRPKGNALVILKVMEKEFATSTPTQEEVFAACAADIEAPRPGRRKEYFLKALARLTDKWVWQRKGCLLLTEAEHE